jgi:tRNA-specific 2-thiouridylase
MSGGVDSSVAAALLADQGYEVIGMMLRLWSEPGKNADNRCCTPDAMAIARRISAQLGIPFYAVDAQEVFHNAVVSAFIEGYSQGITPNPCLVCNRQVRWQFLLKHALSLGADYMATGHYARVQLGPDGMIRLLRAVDRAKDQSYVLHVLNQEQLKHALFPLGGYTKPEVRELARKFHLPVAERPESQDLCFLGAGDYREFLLRNAPDLHRPGPIQTSAGEVVGEHQGLAFYTIGQRKGLGVSSLEPLYVLGKDVSQNTLIIGYKDELGKREFLTAPVRWIAGQLAAMTFHASVRSRYKAQEVSGLVSIREDQRGYVQLESPLRDLTPGQAAVFYDEEICLGGGIIQTVYR